jgi:hypothetical protein
MFKRWIAFQVFCLILIGATSFAWYPIEIRSYISPEIAPGTVTIDTPVRVDIYVTNVTPPQLGFFLMPVFWGLDGLTEVIHMAPDSGVIYSGNVAVYNNFDSYWEMLLQVSDSSWDGILPDYFSYAGISTNGWSEPGEHKLFSFFFMFEQEGSFCLDLRDYQDIYPEWDQLYGFGPICFAVVDTIVCGDLTGDSQINIFDVVEFIKCLYLYFPCEITNGDVNGDGLLNIFDVTYLISYLYMGGPEPNCPPPPPEPSGSLTNISGCGRLEKGIDTVSNIDCMIYSYDGVGTLVLHHINAGLNCCVEEFAVDFDITGDSITITEYDEGICDCNCLYNMDFEIINLPPGAYTITVNEPLRHPDDTVLQFEMDLTSATSGVFCVRRYFYPWGY